MPNVLLTLTEQEQVIEALAECLKIVDAAGELSDDEYFAKTYDALIQTRSIVEDYQKLKSQA